MWKCLGGDCWVCYKKLQKFQNEKKNIYLKSGIDKKKFGCYTSFNVISRKSDKAMKRGSRSLGSCAERKRVVRAFHDEVLKQPRSSKPNEGSLVGFDGFPPLSGIRHGCVGQSAEGILNLGGNTD